MKRISNKLYCLFFGFTIRKYKPQTLQMRVVDNLRLINRFQNDSVYCHKLRLQNKVINNRLLKLRGKVNG